MAFENISKGEFEVIKDSTYPTLHGIWIKPDFDNGIPCYVARTCYAPISKENAEFISYCFNLQQRYDISKLEEAVDMLSGLHLLFKDSSNGTLKAIDEQIKQLLKEIKK